MFRHYNNKTPATPPPESSELDLKTDVDRASFIFLIRQEAMRFGSDRHTSVYSRPAVFLRQRDGMCFVLPATTKPSDGRPEFYAIPKDDVLWTQPERSRDSYVFHRYAAVSRADLLAKIGVLFPQAQVSVVKWLRSRY